MARLIINCKYFFSFLSMTSPRIVIDGMKNNASFSSPNFYNLTPGSHHIKVYLPYPIFMFPTCVAQTVVNVSEGDVISFRYKLPIFVFLSGSLIIENHTKGTPSNAASTGYSNDTTSIPSTCPNCKNPNAKGIRICEWCGSNIA
ncbi:MAG: hypothetical protein NWS43_01055 [Crocinitomicaceae bacterium]|jgi:hypothetical protein|nr:hypothetical protein [Crocinitomicaceae bacterium]